MFQCNDYVRCTNNVMEARHQASSLAPILTTQSPKFSNNNSKTNHNQSDEIKREQERIAYYRTYDVMTGIRIAATLGGFFALMVLLVLYKSKSKTEKALEDPKLAAQAVAEAEEEERQIAAALEATAYEQLNPISRRARRSLDNASSPSPAGWIRSTTRFSSIGGYSSLLEPPTRTHSKLPCSIDEDSPPEYDDLYTYYNRYLNVPRRPSNITCSSSASSYLERRGSSVILGLPALPAHKQRNRRRQSSPLPEQQYDFYYPIDIRVIQPTPGGSPCGSERALYDSVPIVVDEQKKPRMAPLASISSCNSSLAVDYPDLDMNSFTSDSVFRDEEEEEEEDDDEDEIDECEDTENEVDPFSTDSDQSETDNKEGACCRRTSSKLKAIGRRGSKETLTPTSITERPPFPLPSTSADNRSSSSLTLVNDRETDDGDANDGVRTRIQLKECRVAGSRSSLSIDGNGHPHKWSKETLF